MLFRHHRLTLPGAALALLALVSPGDNGRAQAPEPTASDSRSETSALRSTQKTEAGLLKSPSPVPPVPGQLVNGPGSKSAVERPKRVPPILIAFVLLFLITWVRAFVERRRLRARFRQSCESPPQSYI